GMDGRLLHRLKLGRGNGRAHFLIHGDLAPLLRGNEAVPIESGRTGKNSVEVIRIFLRLLVPLATTGRTSVPVGKFWALAVIHVDEPLGPNRLLMNAVEGKVSHQAEIQGAGRIERKRPSVRG